MAKIDVIMPQMGESIAEGTLSRWMKKVGDTVKRDEPIFEISTDKVDAEIPAPQAGVLVEILVQEGQTVADPDGRGPSSRPTPAPPRAPRPRSRRPGARCRAVTARLRSRPRRPSPHRPPRPRSPAPPPPRTRRPPESKLREERLRRKSTPLVRKMAAEHNLDISAISGSGIAGRVTKNDVLSYLEIAPGGRRCRPAARHTRRPSGSRRARRHHAHRSAVAGRRTVARRPGRAVEQDPEAHRRPHDHVAPGVGAREQPLRGGLHPRGAGARAAEEGIRRTGREPHLPRLHRKGDRRHPPEAPGGQFRGHGRRHRLPPRHQYRHRRGARLGAHRPGHQARRRALAPRRGARHQRPR